MTSKCGKNKEVEHEPQAHRAEFYWFSRHLLTVHYFLMCDIIIFLFRASLLWLVRDWLWEYFGLFGNSSANSTAVNQSVGRHIGISSCDKVNNRAVIRPRSLFKITFDKFVRKISSVLRLSKIKTSFEIVSCSLNGFKADLSKLTRRHSCVFVFFLCFSEARTERSSER